MLFDTLTKTLFLSVVIGSEICDQTTYKNLLQNNYEIKNDFFRKEITTKVDDYKFDLTAVKSRLSLAEFNLAKIEENTVEQEKEIDALQIYKNKFETIEKENDDIKVNVENMKTSFGELSARFDEMNEMARKQNDPPFKDLSGWTKINSHASKHLYFKILDNYYDHMDAIKACKKERPDAQLAQVLNRHEIKEVLKMKKVDKNNYLQLACSNSKLDNRNQDNWVWIYSGLNVDSALWSGNEGKDGKGDRGKSSVCIIWRGEDKIHDHQPHHKGQALCELRM